jgi:hypothetical protein
MESLFSFPVGLFHPLQHAGLSRRTPDGRLTSNRVRLECQENRPRLFVRQGGHRIAMASVSLLQFSSCPGTSGAAIRIVGPLWARLILHAAQE